MSKTILPAEAFTDITIRVDMLLCHEVGRSADGRLRLSQSRGRRKAGRDARFVLHTDKGDRLCFFTAPTISAAIDKANKKLAATGEDEDES